MKQSHIAIIGAPMDLGAGRRGVDMGPSALRLAGLVVKNVVGIVFLLAGFAMLFLPGQGVLTMLIGISLMDFPKKRELEAKMVGQPTVLGVINSMRQKFGKPPLTLAPGP